MLWLQTIARGTADISDRSERVDVENSGHTLA